MNDKIMEALTGYMDALEAKIASVDASVTARVRAELDGLRVSLLEAVKASLPESISGPEGPMGPQGERGVDGASGAPGERGEPGPMGPAGPQGEKGADGLPGERGADGAPGAMGPAGPQGERGMDGLRGEKGEPGPQGMAGEAGARGPKGERGLDGRDGKDGRDGVATMDQLTTLIAEGIEQRLAAVVTDRVAAELAAWPKPEYRQVWTADGEYRLGNLVSWGGSLWICNASGTTDRPGDGSAGWTLAAKRGRDGKDGRP